jgi:hypothetical protein
MVEVSAITYDYHTVVPIYPNPLPITFTMLDNHEALNWHGQNVTGTTTGPQ